MILVVLYLLTGAVALVLAGELPDVRWAGAGARAPPSAAVVRVISAREDGSRTC